MKRHPDIQYPRSRNVWLGLPLYSICLKMVRCAVLLDRGRRDHHSIAIIMGALAKGALSFFIIVISAGYQMPNLFAEEGVILVRQIEIIGNQKIDSQTLLSKLDIRQGDTFSPEAVQGEIKKLYQLGYFDQIAVKTDPYEGGITLLFVVSERPTLTEISFEGNNNMGEDTLKGAVAMKQSTLVDSALINKDVEKITALYKKEGYDQVEVIPALDRLSDDKAALTFLIREGEKTSIRTIRFNGNAAFTERALKKQIHTKAYFWLTSWFADSGYFNEEELDSDQDRIRDFYLDAGYLDVKIRKPEYAQVTDPDGNQSDIIFTIMEGEPYTIEKIEYVGHPLFTTTQLAEVTGSRAGELFSKKKIRDDIRAVTDLYGKKGYLFANVTPQIQQNPTDKVVAVSFHINEDQPYRVRQIKIEGNSKTRDKVIRREMRQNERESVSTENLRRSFQRIHNLNFFETIDIVPQKVSEDEIDLNVKVTEKSTGSFIMGGGYSSVDRLVGQVELNQGNLFGKGQLLRARAEFGKRRTTYSLTFREPYLFDSTYSGTASLFDRAREFENYNEKRRGGDVILGKSLSDTVAANLSFTREDLFLFDVNRHAPAFILSQADFGKTHTNAVGFSITRDTRDFRFDPKKGTYNALSLEHAGTVLGGDNDYYKISLDSGKFFPAIKGHVFSLHGQIGFAEGIGEKMLPVGERFFVGGINTVRGFRFGKAGPLTPDGVIQGGNKQLFFNAEYLIPLVAEAGLKAVFFYDYGRAFDDAEAIRLTDLREGIGAGIRWISPVGPLRFEWGRNIHPQPNESQTEFDFSIGTLF